MPCIDRQRVADITLKIIHAHFDVAVTVHDNELLLTYLTIMLNMSSFTNAHATLLGLDIMALLGMIAAYTAREKKEGTNIMLFCVIAAGDDFETNIVFANIMLICVIAAGDNGFETNIVFAECRAFYAFTS